MECAEETCDPAKHGKIDKRLSGFVGTLIL